MYLTVTDVKKSYGNGQRVQVLKGVSTGLAKGQMCVIYGPSGSGKSTFLNTIGALDTVDSGTIMVVSSTTTGKTPKHLSLFRPTPPCPTFSLSNLLPIPPLPPTFR